MVCAFHEMLLSLVFYIRRGLEIPPPSQQTNKQIPSEAIEEPSDTVIHFYFCFFLHPQESSALSQSAAMIVQ